MINPVVSFPSMNEEHGKDHLFSELLDALSKGRGNDEMVKRVRERMRRNPPALGRGYEQQEYQTKIAEAPDVWKQTAALRHAEGYEPLRENRMWRQS